MFECQLSNGKKTTNFRAKLLNLMAE